MACTSVLTPISITCDNNIGGLSNIYVVPRYFITSFGTETASVLSGVTLSGTTKLVEYQFNKNTASYTDVLATNFENGSSIYQQTINLMIPRREAAKRTSIALLAAGQRDLVVIAKDYNGIYWLFGKDSGLQLQSIGEGSGTAKADGSKYSLVLYGEEPYSAVTITEANVLTLI